MGTITSGIGLISGINTSSIIDQLMTIESQPKTLLQSQIDEVAKEKQAFTDLATQLSTLQTTGQSLQKTSAYQAASTTSSNESVLTATATNGASVGSFQFQVAQLVSTQQAITSGFADSNNTKVGAGTLTIDRGGGELQTKTLLSSLRGGQGIHQGVFRITDRSGHTAAIDITNAITLDDVAQKINTALDINVKATVGKQGLIITDETGQTTGNLIIKDVGNGATAADLGIAGSVAADTVTGASISTLGRSTALAALNDGRGVRSGSTSGGADFRITGGDGTTYNVTITGAMKTVGDVLDAINTATGGKVRAAIASNGMGINLTDANGGTVVVNPLNNPNTAKDLGIEGTSIGTLTGTQLVAGPDSVLISSLNGGSGLQLGTISITDRAGHSASVDLSSAKTVQDILDAINNSANNLGITASIKDSGNGIQLTDTSGGTGDVTIADQGGTNTAAALGIAGTFGITTSVINGANLHRQYVSENTQLADYNGGKGVSLSKFRITTASGATADIDLSSGNFLTLGQVIQNINARGIGVTASINANGNGLLLTDSSTGAGHLTVTDVNGTAAADLNINGTAAANTIDGAQEKTIDITANDTLTTVQQKINALGFGVSASIIDDGSSATPYRLSLNARDTGTNGRFVFDAGSTGLQTHNLVEAQDAAVFVGGSSTGSQPLLVTSSTNQLTNVIKGVTIDLHGVSTSPVTLTVSPSSDSLVSQLQSFTDTFNGLVDKINTLTNFDTTTNTGGVLMGDSTTQQVQEDMYAMLSGVVDSGGKYKILADVGITLGDGAKLQFDADKFRSAYAADPESVQQLFTTADKGIAYLIDNQMKKLVDPVSGAITQENQTLDNRTRDYNDRMTYLNALLDAKKTRLQTQFNNMEQVLAKLQSQQSALSSLSLITSSGSTSSSSSKSSSSSSSSSSG